MKIFTLPLLALFSATSFSSSCLILESLPVIKVTKESSLLCENEALKGDEAGPYLILDKYTEDKFQMDHGYYHELFDGKKVATEIKILHYEMVEKRLFWLKKAGELGSAEAIYRIGIIYTFKDHQLKDYNLTHLESFYNYDLGMKYIYQAVSLNHPDAMYTLGHLLESRLHSESSDESRNLAFNWYSRGVNAGSYLAAIRYCYLHLNYSHKNSGVVSLAWHIIALVLMKQVEGYDDALIGYTRSSYYLKRSDFGYKYPPTDKELESSRLLAHELVDMKFNIYGYPRSLLELNNSEESWGEWSEDDTIL